MTVPPALRPAGCAVRSERDPAAMMRTSARTRLSFAAALSVLVAAILFHPTSRAADPAVVTAHPVTMSRTGGERFGHLLWRGGLVLDSPDPAFGGFSGLLLGADGRDMLAVSDLGRWWRARLIYDARGHLSGLRDPAGPWPVLSSRGAPLRGGWRDAEALAPWDGRRTGGPVLVGFERRERVAVYDWGARGRKANARYLFLPKEVGQAPRNGEMEGLARFWNGPRAGWLIAAAEKGFTSAGDVRAWLWRGRRVVPFAIRRKGEFRITDIAVLPSGRGFVTLERRFKRSLTVLPAFTMRLFRSGDIGRGAVLDGVELMEASWPLHAIDNMEGLSVHRAGGELRLTVISDDNFNRSLQRTLLFQFALPVEKLNRLLDGGKG